MQDFTVEQIQEKFNRLPPEMQEAISSVDMHEKVKALAKKNGLMIDQQGELVDQVGLVMLGLAKSSDFVRDVSERLSVDTIRARAIADDVNAQIFEAVKINLRDNDDKQTEYHEVADNASLEAAGGFTIEPTGQGNDRDDGMIEAVTEKDKEKLLAGIENPPPAREMIAPRESMKPEPIRSEPLVDQLLKGSSALPAEKIVRKEESQSKAPAEHATAQPPKNLPTNDTYREPIQ